MAAEEGMVGDSGDSGRQGQGQWENNYALPPTLFLLLLSNKCQPSHAYAKDIIPMPKQTTFTQVPQHLSHLRPSSTDMRIGFDLPLAGLIQTYMQFYTIGLSHGGGR